MSTWGNCNFTEFKKMANTINKNIESGIIDEFFIQLLNDIGNLLLNKTKKRTPVATGDLRRSWYVSKVIKQVANYKITIYNTKDYAIFVENGFRSHFVPGYWQGDMFVYDRTAKTGMYVGDKASGWKEGRFMLLISVKEIENNLDKITDKAVQNFLRKFFDVR